MSQKNCFLPESTASDPFSGLIDDKPLRFRGEVYHGYHFNCTACGVELNSEAREVRCRPGFAANEMVSLRMFHMVSYQLEECSELQATKKDVCSIFRMSCIVCAVMIRWAFPFVVLVDDQLRNVWLLHLGNTGMLK